MGKFCTSSKREDTWKAVQIILATGLIVGLLCWQHWCHFELVNKLMNERNLYYRVLPSPHGLTRQHRTKQSKTKRVMHVFSSNKTKFINKKGRFSPVMVGKRSPMIPLYFTEKSLKIILYFLENICFFYSSFSELLLCMMHVCFMYDTINYPFQKNTLNM